MTKSLSIVIHKNYILSVSEGFAMFLKSKLTTCFIDGFHFENKIPINKNKIPMLIYSTKVNIYIGLWTLKMECTRYGLCTQVAFNNPRAISFCFF